MPKLKWNLLFCYLLMWSKPPQSLVPEQKPFYYISWVLWVENSSRSWLPDSSAFTHGSLRTLSDTQLVAGLGCAGGTRELQSHAGHFGSWWQEGWAQWGLSPRVPRYSLANMAASRWLGFLEVRVLRINCATQSLITKNTRAGSFFYWSTALFQRLSKDMPW